MDVGFDPGTGVEFEPGIPLEFRSGVEALAVQRDGKILVGGPFTAFAGTTVLQGLVRLDTHGALDPAFQIDAGVDGSVYAIVIQPDGEILIGGNSNVVRLHVDGQLDASFHSGNAADGFVQSVAFQANGKIVVGGLFIRFDGETRNGVARLKADGSLDGNLQGDTAPGLDGYVASAAVQADGKIVIAGEFVTFGRVARNHIARINADGSLDTGFDPGRAFTPVVQGGFPVFHINSVLAQPDGKILAAGVFGAYDGVANSSILRLNPDGTLDASFDSGTSDAEIYEMVLQPDGKIVVVGDFTEFQGRPHHGIARLNADGSRDNAFHPGTGVNGGLDFTFGVTLQTDGKIIVLGSFKNFNGVPRRNVVRLNEDGTLDPTFQPAIGPFTSDSSSFADVVSSQPDGKVLIGGTFNAANGVMHNGLIRLNADGSIDGSFQPDTGANTAVEAVSVQSDGRIIIGGGFASVNGTARDGLARLNADGSLDEAFNPDFGVEGQPLTIVAQADGKLVVGGDFNQVGENVRNYIARLDTDGSDDPGFVPREGTLSVAALAIQPGDGEVLVGGNFSEVGGAAINALARLNTDGSVDPSFAPGFAAGDTVQALALQPDDGEVLVAALVTDDTETLSATASGIPPYRPYTQSKIKNPITRCHKPNGQIDPTFNAATDGVTLAVLGLPGRLAVIGGNFANVDGAPHANLARLNADGTLDTGFIGMADGKVRALSLQPGGSAVIVGGDFRQRGRHGAQSRGAAQRRR